MTKPDRLVLLGGATVVLALCCWKLATALDDAQALAFALLGVLCVAVQLYAVNWKDDE